MRATEIGIAMMRKLTFMLLAGAALLAGCESDSDSSDDTKPQVQPAQKCPSTCANGCEADGTTCKQSTCPSTCTNGCEADGTTCKQSTCPSTCVIGCEADGTTCKQSTAPSHSTNFDWLHCEDKSPNKQNRYDTTFTTEAENYQIEATGRCNLQEDKVTSVLDFSIDGAGIMLNTTKNPTSGIVVTVTSGGIGTVSVDVNAWDTAYVYLIKADGSFVYHNGSGSPESVPENTQKRLVFPVNDKSATTFTLKSNHNDTEHPDYRARLVLDNLMWTEAE